MQKETKNHFFIPSIFLLSRLLLFLSLPLEGLRGYGDYWNFYHQASLGIPFVDYWTEFPPVFPFLSSLVYRLVQGRQHAYEYLLAFLFSLAQAGSFYLFSLITEQIYPEEQSQQRRIWIYFALTIGLFYGWGYFDPLAIFAFLAAIYYLTKYFDTEKSQTMKDFWLDLKLSAILAIGVLIKWFPALALAAVWRKLSPRRALKITAITLGLTALVWGGLYLASPQMTTASLISQGSKGSWETVWALIDGNLGTGNFSQQIDRLIPQTASYTTGNPAKVPPWLTLIFFGGLGLWIFWKAKLDTPRKLIAFIGITWCVFMFWSPGYSPQWVLYLLPLILLALPEREALLVAVIFVLLSLLEWPILLSRGYFKGLWGIIPLRSVVFLLLAVLFFKEIKTTLREEL